MDLKSGMPHLCYAGLALAMFLLIFPCLMMSMFLMVAPWSYLKATQALYTLVVAFYTIHIILDLAIVTWSTSRRIKFRTAVAILCPAFSAILTLPVACMLMYTKDQDGFNSDTADTALAFSIIVMFLLALHAVLAVRVYRTHHLRKKCLECGSLWGCLCFGKTWTDETVQLPSAESKNKDDNMNNENNNGVKADSQRSSPTTQRLNRYDTVAYRAAQSELVFNCRRERNPPIVAPHHVWVNIPEFEIPGFMGNKLPPPPSAQRMKQSQMSDGATTEILAPGELEIQDILSEAIVANSNINRDIDEHPKMTSDPSRSSAVTSLPKKKIVFNPFKTNIPFPNVGDEYFQQRTEGQQDVQSRSGSYLQESKTLFNPCEPGYPKTQDFTPRTAATAISVNQESNFDQLQEKLFQIRRVQPWNEKHVPMAAEGVEDHQHPAAEAAVTPSWQQHCIDQEPEKLFQKRKVLTWNWNESTDRLPSGDVDTRHFPSPKVKVDPALQKRFTKAKEKLSPIRQVQPWKDSTHHDESENEDASHA